MPKKLHLLLLEDCPSHAELMERELRKARIAFCSKRVETRQGFLEALQIFSPDLVLAGYCLPEFTGLEALRLLKQLGWAIPFILVTDVRFEETALEILKEGADDYILKWRPKRLPSAVLKALQKKELERKGNLAGQALEQALRQSEERFRLLVESVKDYAIFMLDLDGHVASWNNGAEHIFGYLEREILGRSFSRLFTPEDIERGQPQQELRTALAEGRAGDERWQVRKDGTCFWASGVVTPLWDEAGTLRGFSKVARDITERRRAEQREQAAQQQVRHILESIGEGFFACDRQWRFTYVNQKAAELVRRPREELLGKNVWELSPEAVGGIAYTELHRAAAEQVPVHFDDYSAPLKLWLETDAYPSPEGLSIFVRDITERKHLEQQLRQSQKMEAIGKLAGGVAHDFNNLLTAILGYSELTLRQLEEHKPLVKNIEEVLKAGRRAMALTNQLLAFSRRQVLQPQLLDLNAVVRNMHRLLRRLIGEHIELVTVFGAGLGAVRADLIQFEQVLLNLAVNARDAMPEGGKLVIETANVELDQAYAHRHAEVSPGSYVLLAVSDTGHGIDKHQQSHIFEPFFTTKEVGKGTGLGLSTVYGIVKQSGGSISVCSEAGQGATFKVYLPRVKERVEAVEPVAVPAGATRGWETVLLVEDEEVVRNMVRDILTSHGYRVLEAQHGGEALELALQHPGRIDLLLTDVIMPQMGGRQLARRLASARPLLRVLYMSGYTDDSIVEQGVLEPGTSFLPKPFTVRELVRKLREVLEGESYQVKKAP
jgi:two-component system, cell cycle sensor histidine kinase and response regulator CckA